MQIQLCYIKILAFYNTVLSLIFHTLLYVLNNYKIGAARVDWLSKDAKGVLKISGSDVMQNGEQETLGTSTFTKATNKMRRKTGINYFRSLEVLSTRGMLGEGTAADLSSRWKPTTISSFLSSAEEMEIPACVTGNDG